MHKVKFIMHIFSENEGYISKEAFKFAFVKTVNGFWSLMNTPRYDDQYIELSSEKAFHMADIDQK